MSSYCQTCYAHQHQITCPTAAPFYSQYSDKINNAYCHLRLEFNHLDINPRNCLNTTAISCQCPTPGTDPSGQHILSKAISSQPESSGTSTPTLSSSMVYMSSPASSLPTLPGSPRGGLEVASSSLYPKELAQSDGENADDELSEDSEMESIGCPEDSDDENEDFNKDVEIDVCNENFETDDEIDDEFYDEFDEETNDETGDEISDGFGSDENMNGEDLALDHEYSFISFGRSVHFPNTLESVIPINTCDDCEENPQAEMTCHERIQLSQTSETCPPEYFSVNGRYYDPDEHTRDIIDLDKALLFAYINGLRTINIDVCRSILRSRTLHRRQSGIEGIPVETVEYVNEYLDRVVELLLGFFPNLFNDDEYSQLLNHAGATTSFDDLNNIIYEPESIHAQKMIKSALDEKLADDKIFLANELFEWFAGELIEPLSRRASILNIC